jgi:hypothetical protein
LKKTIIEVFNPKKYKKKCETKIQLEKRKEKKRLKEVVSLELMQYFRC